VSPARTRLLIIGSSGFLGQHVARKAGAAFEVFEGDLARPAVERGVSIDITSAASVNAAFAKAPPAAAILLAAVSDIDDCERRPALAEAVNVCGAAHVAAACHRTGARLLFTSSAAVFDGTRHGYSEADSVTPVSVYGRTKARAEQLIREELPGAAILRMALVIGFAQGDGTNAMLNKFAAKLSAGEPVALPDFEFRNPIDVETLADAMVEVLMQPGASGVFHLGATECISRFDLGVRLAARMGFSTQLVQAQTEPIPGRAPRGLHHFLLPERIAAVRRKHMPTCDEMIERATHGFTKSHS
jgi:dTDP-4-dehydrorhamnose reductase